MLMTNFLSVCVHSCLHSWKCRPVRWMNSIFWCLQQLLLLLLVVRPSSCRCRHCAPTTNSLHTHTHTHAASVSISFLHFWPLLSSVFSVAGRPPLSFWLAGYCCCFCCCCNNNNSIFSPHCASFWLAVSVFLFTYNDDFVELFVGLFSHSLSLSGLNWFSSSFFAAFFFFFFSHILRFYTLFWPYSTFNTAYSTFSRFSSWRHSDQTHTHTVVCRWFWSSWFAFTLFCVFSISLLLTSLWQQVSSACVRVIYLSVSLML